MAIVSTATMTPEQLEANKETRLHIHALHTVLVELEQLLCEDQIIDDGVYGRLSYEEAMRAALTLRSTILRTHGRAHMKWWPLSGCFQSATKGQAISSEGRASTAPRYITS